jgi:L-arabinose isomerase
LKNEFASAAKSFEDAGVDAVVTLHLAYSPSLESADALAGTELPIIVLDTTPTFGYSPKQNPEELMYNHGIHGVQDMCNVLIRRGKDFVIEAGHWEKSDVLDRTAAWARAASVAKKMKTARVGLIGKPFAGMGDFAVPQDVLRSTIGVEAVQADFAALSSFLPGENDKEVEAEIASDRAKFAAEGVDPGRHRTTTRACLAVRRWIEREKLTAFTFNFGNINRSTGMPTAPFLEASKAMSRGLGYAGEGDVLTASLVGALASAYPETTFTEMFCPDWEGGSIFLSHMGEVNVNLVDGKPVLVGSDMPWVDADPPVFAIGRFRGGKAVFVNLAPGPENTYTLILAPIEMLDVQGEDRMSDSIRGWFRPGMPVAEFLTEYSLLGGTHHAALVYGDVFDDLARFGRMMNWDIAVVE